MKTEQHDVRLTMRSGKVTWRLPGTSESSFKIGVRNSPSQPVSSRRYYRSEPKREGSCFGSTLSIPAEWPHDFLAHFSRRFGVESPLSRIRAAD